MLSLETKSFGGETWNWVGEDREAASITPEWLPECHSICSSKFILSSCDSMASSKMSMFLLSAEGAVIVDIGVSVISSLVHCSAEGQPLIIPGSIMPYCLSYAQSVSIHPFCLIACLACLSCLDFYSFICLITWCAVFIYLYYILYCSSYGAPFVSQFCK